MKFVPIFIVALAFAATTQASPMRLTRRRFGQEHTPEADATFQEIKDLAQGSDKEAQAGNLSGAMVRALLAKAPDCDQQDRADEIIDLGQEFGGDKEEQFIKLAKTYRQLERNTPNVGQPSALCKKAPRHKELEGLVQAQDPTGDGNNKPKEEKPKEKPKEDKPKKKPKEEKPKKKPKEEKPKEKPKEDDSQNVAETDPVGDVKMPKITKNGEKFVVNGNEFVNVEAAHNRQCDIQHNLCFNKFNAGDRSFSGADCDNQNNVCKEGPPVFA